MEAFLVLVYLAVGLFSLICMVKVFEKAGYSGAYALLLLIPLVNLYILGVLAFQAWPIERKDASKMRKTDTINSPASRKHYPKIPFVNYCLNCGRAISSNSNYCGGCGGIFEDEYLDYKLDNCPYCESKNINDSVSKKAKDETEKNQLGYDYLWKGHCFECNKNWYWKEPQKEPIYSNDNASGVEREKKTRASGLSKEVDQFCFSCGRKIDLEMSFCPKCGRQL